MVSRLSGRERILAEILHQRGNCAVTNKFMQFRARADAVLRDNPKTRA
jgi:hypothetical protein